jgi:hypothetical protein
MANGLQLPFQGTSQGPGDAFTITSNVEIQDNQTVAAISGINTGPLKVIFLGGHTPPVSIGILGDSSKNAGIGVQGNSSGNAGVQGNDSGTGTGVMGTSAKGIGISGKGPTAGYFEGDVKVTGTLVAQVDFVVGSTKFTELALQVQQLQTQVTQLQAQLQQLEKEFSAHVHAVALPLLGGLNTITNVLANPAYGPFLVHLISPEEDLIGPGPSATGPPQPQAPSSGIVVDRPSSSAT